MSEKGWVSFGSVAEVKEKRFVAQSIEGKEIAVVALVDRLAAIQRKCPHEGANLDQGQIFAGKVIKCPLHGFMFDLFSGKGLNCPALHITIYPLKVENGEVFVRADLAPAGGL